MGSVGRAQSYALDLILNDRVLVSLLMMEERYGKNNAYTLEEYMADVKNAIWKELKTGKSIDMFRRNVQKNYTIIPAVFFWTIRCIKERPG